MHEFVFYEFSNLKLNFLNKNTGFTIFTMLLSALAWTITNIYIYIFLHLNLDAEQLQYAGLFPVHGKI